MCELLFAQLGPAAAAAAGAKWCVGGAVLRPCDGPCSPLGAPLWCAAGVALPTPPSAPGGCPSAPREKRCRRGRWHRREGGLQVGAEGVGERHSRAGGEEAD